MGTKRPDPSGEVAGHCKNNWRKNLDGRGWKKGDGKARNWWRKWRAAAPPTRRFQTALRVLCRGHYRREARACSQEVQAPRSRPAARDGRPPALPHLSQSVRGLGLFVGFYPQPRANETPSLRGGPAHSAERAWTPPLRSGTHVMVTVRMHIFQSRFPADAGHSSGGGEPFSNLHKGSSMCGSQRLNHMPKVT